MPIDNAELRIEDDPELFSLADWAARFIQFCDEQDIDVFDYLEGVMAGMRIAGWTTRGEDAAMIEKLAEHGGFETVEEWEEAQLDKLVRSKSLVSEKNPDGIDVPLSMKRLGLFYSDLDPTMAGFLRNTPEDRLQKVILRETMFNHLDDDDWWPNDEELENELVVGDKVDVRAGGEDWFPGEVILVQPTKLGIRMDDGTNRMIRRGSPDVRRRAADAPAKH